MVVLIVAGIMVVISTVMFAVLGWRWRRTITTLGNLEKLTADLHVHALRQESRR